MFFFSFIEKNRCLKLRPWITILILIELSTVHFETLNCLALAFVLLFHYHPFAPFIQGEILAFWEH